MAFRGMLTCAHDNCTVTAEIKKNKYVYYHCTGHRGPCALPRFKEQEIADKMGHVLQDVCIPEEVVKRMKASLQTVDAQMRSQAAQERARMERELAALHSRMDAAYNDKLDGKISEGFWQRKQADWQAEELRIKSLIAELEEDKSGERLLNVQEILELAQDAHSLYVTLKPAEQAKLLKSVLWNYSIDAVSLYPTYRKPFELIYQRAKTSEWSGRRDSNPRSQVATMPFSLLDLTAKHRCIRDLPEFSVLPFFPNFLIDGRNSARIWYHWYHPSFEISAPKAN
jgi:hypothetical protein